jgi:hypothetical protein
MPTTPGSGFAEGSDLPEKGKLVLPTDIGVSRPDTNEPKWGLVRVARLGGTRARRGRALAHPSIMWV